MKTDKEKIALAFYSMCAGQTSGHMAMIPNNKEIFSFLKSISNEDSFDAMSKNEFALFLKEVSETLYKEPKF